MIDDDDSEAALAERERTCVSASLVNVYQTFNMIMICMRQFLLELPFLKLL